MADNTGKSPANSNKTSKKKSGRSGTKKSKNRPPQQVGETALQILRQQPNRQAMENMMSKGKTQMDKFANDATSMGREGMEAFIKSSTIFAKGFEDIIRTGVTLAQNSAEKQARFMKEAMSSKTLNEWTETQNKIAQANFDDFMATTTKLSEMSVKLMTEAAEPLNEQMHKGIRKASDMKAA